MGGIQNPLRVKIVMLYCFLEKPAVLVMALGTLFYERMIDSYSNSPPSGAKRHKGFQRPIILAPTIANMAFYIYKRRLYSAVQ